VGDEESTGTKTVMVATLVSVALLAIAVLFLLLQRRTPERGSSHTASNPLASPQAPAAQVANRSATALHKIATRSPAPPSQGDSGPSLKTLQSLFDLSKLLEKNAALAEMNVDRYCAETSKLPKHVFDDLPDGGQQRDAAYLMEPLVTWNTHPPREGLLALPPALVDRIRAAGTDWPTALTARDAAGLDFSWMAQLQGYDDWSLATVGAVADTASTIDPLWSPIPDYGVLTAYAKLRLVQALQQGDTAAALAQVRHLANIVASNGILIAQIQAARLISLEQPFLAATARPEDPPPDSNAPVLDSAWLKRFRDLSLAGAEFALPGVDDAVFKKAMACVPDPCATISEAISMRVELRRISDQIDDPSFWSYAKQQSCDQNLVALLSATPSGSIEELAREIGEGPSTLEELFGALDGG
jgi:hypothetical protein